MCGIAGAVDYRDGVDPSIVVRMRDALAHRGPDDSGLYVSPSGLAVFGHRRLNIIDTSAAGHQPMSNEASDIWVTYNGEIYNFLALRRELERCGHVFRSNSDTEVLVHGYEEWGTGVVERLNGIFAFAIWDESKRKLFAARDPLGVKPFYYVSSGHIFAFASELKGLLDHPNVRRSIRVDALADYFVYGYVPGDKAIFENVSKLQAGHLLNVEDGSTEIRRYWKAEFRGTQTDPDEMIAKVRAQVRASTLSQLLSDVPVGCFLSGGLDSTTVATYASGQGSLQTFSLGFDVASYDEAPQAQHIASVLGTVHSEGIANGQRAGEVLETLADSFDEPFFDTSAIPTFLVSELASKSVKVVLAGDGGDEVFGGYSWYQEFFRDSYRRRALRSTRLGVGALELGISALRGHGIASRVAKYSSLVPRDPVDQYFYQRCICDEWDLGRMAGPAVREDFDRYEPRWLFRSLYHQDWPPLLAMQTLDLETFLVDDILVKVDRASMRHSLEVRVPLLDKTLVDLVFSGGIDLHSPRGQPKWLLRRAVGPDVPPAALTHPKHGFSSPMKEWMQRSMSGLATDLIENGRVVRDGLVDAQHLSWLSSTPAPGRWNQIWLAIQFEYWYRRWMR